LLSPPTQNISPLPLSIFSGTPVYLFCRVHEKLKSQTQPFVYCGRLVPEDYQDRRPVKVRYTSAEYRPALSDELDAIYA